MVQAIDKGFVGGLLSKQCAEVHVADLQCGAVAMRRLAEWGRKQIFQSGLFMVESLCYCRTSMSYFMAGHELSRTGGTRRDNLSRR